jgi:hypothetical protein
MGAIRAGDIRQLTINGREYDVKAGDASVEIDLGGFENTADLGGNGSLQVTQRRMTAGFSACPISIDDVRKDLEALVAISNAGTPVPVNITIASGMVYSGQLVLVGDFKKNTGDGTCAIEMRGAKFEQI